MPKKNGSTGGPVYIAGANSGAMTVKFNKEKPTPWYKLPAEYWRARRAEPGIGNEVKDTVTSQGHDAPELENV